MSLRFIGSSVLTTAGILVLAVCLAVGSAAGTKPCAGDRLVVMEMAPHSGAVIAGSQRTTGGAIAVCRCDSARSDALPPRVGQPSQGHRPKLVTADRIACPLRI